MDDILSHALKKRPVFTVSELGVYIRRTLSRDALLGRLTVSGEISSLRTYSSGHMYFTLKDEDAVLRCVMFRQQAAGLAVEPMDGMTAEVDGYISFYERDGQLQLYAEDIRPAGKGALYAAFEKLREKLSEEGLFDAEHKKPLPFLPRKIAVVTSRDGAVLHDIIKVAKGRSPGTDIVLIPTRVQGAEAPEEIAAALRTADAIKDVDIIIAGRGGGSLEDLWAFNTETVARAMYECVKPVISAVGHETDYTIADFVADFRAPTPSAAAETAVPETREIKTLLSGYASALSVSAERRISNKRFALTESKNILFSLRPDNLISGRRMRVSELSAALSHAAGDAAAKRMIDTDRLGERLSRAAASAVERKRQTVVGYAASLSAMNPEAVFRRGYSAVVDGYGRPVKSASALSAGDRVGLLFADGRRGATIDEGDYDER